MNFLRRRIKSEHERVAGMLSAYVDDELAAREKERVETHLAHCDSCAADLRTLRYTKALLTEAPMPSLPRSFVIRQADLEKQSVSLLHRLFGSRSKLAYTYLKGATAAAAVVLALLLTSDLIAQFGLGLGQPAVAPAEKVYVTEQEIAHEPTVVARETVQVERVVEKEVEKAVIPVATPSPLPRSATPAATLGKVQKDAQIEEALEGVPIQAAQETTDYSTDEALGPTPTVTMTPLLPTPTATPSPTATPLKLEERDRRCSVVRIIEIGLGGLLLILLVATLVIRRRQTWGAA